MRKYVFDKFNYIYTCLIGRTVCVCFEQKLTRQMDTPSRWDHSTTIPGFLNEVYGQRANTSVLEDSRYKLYTITVRIHRQVFHNKPTFGHRNRLSLYLNSIQRKNWKTQTFPRHSDWILWEYPLQNARRMFSTWPQDYETFVMLNSTVHGWFPLINTNCHFNIWQWHNFMLSWADLENF